MTNTEPPIPARTVGLWLRGTKLEPDIISRTLQCAPTRSWKKGDIHISPNTAPITRKTGVWSLIRKDANVDVSIQIEDILDSINAKKNILEMGMGVDEAELSVFEAQDIILKKPHKFLMHISPDIISRISILGLDFSCEVIVDMSL